MTFLSGLSRQQAANLHKCKEEPDLVSLDRRLPARNLSKHLSVEPTWESSPQCQRDEAYSISRVLTAGRPSSPPKPGHGHRCCHSVVDGRRELKQLPASRAAHRGVGTLDIGLDIDWTPDITGTPELSERIRVLMKNLPHTLGKRRRSNWSSLHSDMLLCSKCPAGKAPGE